MSRLFITLYLLILAAAFSFMFGINPAVNFSLSGALASYNYKGFQGTVYLLDQHILKKHNSTIISREELKNETLQEIINMFSYEINLISLKDINFTEKEKKIFKKYQAIERVKDKGEYSYLPSKVIADHIWELQVFPTQDTFNHDLVIGSAILIENHIKQYPTNEWKQHLSQLNEHFGLPISLHKIDSEEISSFTPEKKALLMQYRIAGFDIDKANERYYYLIKKSDYVLKAGPIPPPFITRYILLLVCIGLCTLFATAIYLWVRPLWRNLSALQEASKKFGQGSFDSRVKITKLSPIRSSLEAFNSMADRVQTLISSHKDLTNAVSHEIRTPLARMRFSLEMMQTADNKKDQERFSNEIETDIEELDSLINELLTYARFEREQPEINYSNIEIIPWLKSQITRSQKLTNTISITLDHTSIITEATYQFESRLLARALSNLIQNAIRYAKKQIHIILAEENSSLLISIEDDGEGIPKEKRDTIFDPFTRADNSRNRETGGFGIGLAIVKQITEWHKGTVILTASQLGGAKFTIHIPIENQEA
ncbi:MAG: ATP-binding protein [Cellvibrionaceae bacterium]